jgi:GLPGLI family protein
MLFCFFGKASDYTKSGKVIYHTLYRGKIYKENPLILEYSNNVAKSYSDLHYDSLIIGTPKQAVITDFKKNKIFTTTQVGDGSRYYYVTNLDSLKKLNISEKGEETILGYKCKKATVSLFSNRIDIWYTTEAGIKGSPWQRNGKNEGLVLKVTRNGDYGMVADRIEFTDSKKLIPNQMGEKVTSTILYEKNVDSYTRTITVFDEEQLSWGKKDDPNDNTYGKIFHFRNGTIIAKKIKLPEDIDYYDIYAEVRQRSNGDAYDRTGNINFIPVKDATIIEALMNGKKAYDKVLKEDQIVGVRHENYIPYIEMMRFMTSFGVGHFNDRRKITGINWENESWLKQEITDLKPMLKGEVWVVAGIDNYDAGGHKLSLKLKYYPTTNKRYAPKPAKKFMLPLFSTMGDFAKAPYPKMFVNDSLTVNFEVPEGVKNLRLKYITTGHGGAGDQDEFNPKENEIFIDGERVFSYTPWRAECGTHRKYNPSSGNFWNGVSSSDLSRSGWCPGTISNPVYVNLKDVKPGKHQMKIAIPIRTKDGKAFSHWLVSGVLLGEYDKGESDE